MKKIRLLFFTQKGVDAYKKVKSEKVSFREQLIVNRVFKETTITEKPLVIEIKILIGHLAVNLEIDNKIRQTMKDKGCTEGEDYKMEVIY
jgi:hypothetical protein